MQVSQTTWSETERKIAEQAFKNAYQRETVYLIDSIREKANSLTDLEDLWKIHDLLSAKRHEIDGKYDYKYSVLIFVFAQLLKEGWLNLDELSGLEKDKLAKITSLSKM